jgi:hypothetical protein
MRTILTKALTALAITTIVALGADSTIGTWKLNIVKSKYDPAPMPVKRLTVTREALDGGVKVTTTAERADGTAINFSYSAKYDGRDVRVTGNAPYDTIAIRQLNANTLTDERKKAGGPYHATGRTAISNGGTTMTTITEGINAVGKAFTETFVYEKQ